MNEKIDLGIKVRPLKTKGILIYYNENKDVIEVEEYINNLQSKINKAIEYCEEVIKEHSNGEYNVSTTELAIKEHKENIQNVLDILKRDNK